MVEDASARADGGDPEAPAEAPPAKENSRRTRSSRRRLERVLTESSLKAEDHVDEYLEWFEAEPPAEIQQLRSCWCRNLFRIILYGATIAALVYFFVGTYRTKRRERFLSPDKDSGDCKREFLPSLTGTYRLDTNARWETDAKFEPQRALFIVEFQALRSEDYVATMSEVASDLREIAPMPLLESVLFAATHVISVRDGAVRVRFDVDAASFMDLPTLTAGVAGCPTLAADEESSFEFGTHIERDSLVFSFEKDNLDQCVPTRGGVALGDVFSHQHRESFARIGTMDLAVDLHSLVAATAINYGLVRPEDFLDELDGKSFVQLMPSVVRYHTEKCFDPDLNDVDDYGLGCRSWPTADFCDGRLRDRLLYALEGRNFGKCVGCGYGPLSRVRQASDCVSCEDGFELVRVYEDCTGVCVDAATRQRLEVAWPSPDWNPWDDPASTCTPRGADYASVANSVPPAVLAHIFKNETVARSFDYAAYADAECDVFPAYPDASYDGARFYQDVRYPGMAPLACVEDAAGSPVCSVLATGGISIYPAIKVYDEECNRCDSDGRNICSIGAADDDPLGLDFVGALLVGGGLLHEHPKLTTGDRSEKNPQWSYAELLGFDLASAKEKKSLINLAYWRAKASGELFCERSGFSQTECESHDSVECSCKWEDGPCQYDAGAWCPDPDVDDDEHDDEAAQANGEKFCEQSGFTEAECKSYDSPDCRCAWELGEGGEQCYHNVGACYDPEPTSGDDDDDDEAFGIAFCEESGFTEAECKSYDSPECKCEWDDGACWYNEGSCSGLPSRRRMTTTYSYSYDQNDEYDFRATLRAAVCPLTSTGPLLLTYNAYDGDRADVKLNENQYALTSSEWSCRGEDDGSGDNPDATVCRTPEACGCGEGFFCNFDGGDSGACEPCYKYDNLPACYDDGLPRGGELDCVSCCFAGGDDEAAGAVGGPNRRMAAYSARWAHAEVFDKLSESSSTAPVAIELDYYKCKMDLREVVYEALGVSVGNAALVYILTSVICVHALVRALGKCGAVRFRNGRFISPVVLDEYLERKSVDAVLRQEREKETEETDPFLSLPHDPSDPSL